MGGLKGTYGGGEEEVGEVDGALARVGVQARHWRLGGAGAGVKASISVRFFVTKMLHVKASNSTSSKVV